MAYEGREESRGPAAGRPPTQARLLFRERRQLYEASRATRETLLKERWRAIDGVGGAEAVHALAIPGRARLDLCGRRHAVHRQLHDVALAVAVVPAGRDPGPRVEHLAARPFAAVLHHHQADELRHKASPWHFDAALRGSCDRASTDGPYIATGSGGAPIGLRDHRRALDLLPPRSARRAPSTSNGAPASRPTA